MSDGIYLFKFVHEGETYERKVLITDGLYQFTDERGKVLPASTPLRVDLAIQQNFEFTKIDSVLCEMISWKRVETELPDEGLIVLLDVPDASEDVWIGMLDSGEWRWADQSLVKEKVIAWAELPYGLPYSDA